MPKLALYAEWEAVEVDAYGRWADDETVPIALLGPLRERALLDRVTHTWIDEPRPSPFVMEEWLARAAGLRTEVFALYAGELDAPEWKLHVSLGHAGLTLALALGPSRIEPDSRRTLAELVHAWSEPLGRSGCALCRARVESDVPYPRPRPPRESTRWPLGAFDYFLGRAWHACEPERAAAFASIRDADLPAGATRALVGDVLHVALPVDPRDEAEARRASEAWLTPLVPTAPEPGWNEPGDQVAIVIDRDPLEPFTFFDACEGIGYKALVVDPESHDVDEALWERLVRIAASKRTDDGTQVGAVRLVVPVRADASRMHARALAAGLDAVVYPLDSRLWIYAPP